MLKQFKTMPRQVRIAFLVGLLIRVVMPWFKNGFKSMDEHWQVFEPAMSLVDGFWFKSVEWETGARSWFYPALISVLLKVAKFLGLHNPLHLASFVRSILGVIGSFAIPLSYFAINNFVEKAKDSDNYLLRQRIATIMAWFIALWPFSIYCGYHAHAEMVGSVFVLLAIIARNEGRNVVAGALLGFCFLLKIDVAVAGLMAGFWAVMLRQWKQALHLLLGAIPFVFALGWIDYFTWGRWFENVRVHAHLNLVEEIGNQWGVSPWYMHFFYVVAMGSLPFLVGFIVALKRWRSLPERIQFGWFFTLSFIAVFSFVEHKEKRFMAPLIYLAPCLGAATLIVCKSWIDSFIHRVLPGARARKIAVSFACVLFLIHVGAEVRNYVLNNAWAERVEALTNGGLIPDAQKYISQQWPAYFYFPRHIPAEMCGGDPESIARCTKGYDIVATVHDGPNNYGFDRNGFICTPWPAPRRESKDPVPTAYRCQRVRKSL